VENEVKMQIIHVCTSKSLRKKGLSKPMDLKTLLDRGKSMELALSQSHAIEGGMTAETSNRVHKQTAVKGGARRKYLLKKQSEKSFDRFSSGSRTCFNCGGQYPHENDWPTKHRRCYKCDLLSDNTTVSRVLIDIECFNIYYVHNICLAFLYVMFMRYV